MSYKQISITTAEGNSLELTACRQVKNIIERKGLLSMKVIGKSTKFVVQYGLGVAGEGATLRAAVENFQKNWSFFCTNRAAIMRGEIDGWN